ncbi:MAG: hypothetical protein RMI91_06115 [Gemmatales bacterium]|nr:DUF3352 domain-containing protein [Gemmatales bacterium]MDW7994210.1 hypothetical protein [Gemmatales bacterium]
MHCNIPWRFGWGVTVGVIGVSLLAWPEVVPSQEKPVAPRVLEMRTQTVGENIYFHVRLENVPDWPPLRWAEVSRPALALSPGRPMVAVSLFTGAPRLVSQDDVVESAYLLWDTIDLHQVSEEVSRGWFEPARAVERVNNPLELQRLAPRGLHFVGKLRKRAPARFLLIYTTLTEQELPHPFREKERLKVRWPQRQEMPLTIDFSQATPVAAPVNPARHNLMQWDDLEGLFAMGQGQFFAIQAWLTEDHGTGFYDFARIMNNRRYGTTVGALTTRRLNDERDYLQRQFELLTGAAAIAETVQMGRLSGASASISQGPRTEDVADIRGIDIPEVNWHALLKDKKPEIEPLAHLVPRDQYYVHFSNFGRFLEAGDFLEQWGAPILQAFRLAGQDYRLRERYERQLCLKSSVLAKTFGPLVVENVALTGSDLYLREGSDVTVLFRVKNLALFMAAVNNQIDQARKAWGKELKEDKAQYQGVTIESFVTPLREVSTHRCVLDEQVVVYSNSPVAIRRIIDTAKKKLPALAGSDDFRYMRSVFPYKDPNEDAFLFFSDEFLRALLGPVTRIKESRRSEALASLYMLHHGALYAAWQTGKLPATHQDLLRVSGLREKELYQPEGKELRWDGQRQVAVSDAYNTIHFATPLIELPLDKVTKEERQAYESFRTRYIWLWNGAFDPVGLRLRIRPQEVVAETFILPLINVPQYRNLRQEYGGKTVQFDLEQIPPEGILYWLVHFPETSSLRRFLGDILRPNLGPNFQQFFRAIGEQARLGLHDDPFLADLAENLLLGYLLGSMKEVPDHAYMRQAFSLPVIAGVDVRNPLIFATILSALKALVDNAAPQLVTWQPLEKDQHGYKIVAIRPVPNEWLDRWFNPPDTPEKDRFTPGIYYTTVGNMFYVSLREDILRQIIDWHVAQKKAKAKPGATALGKTVEAHMVLQLSPQAAKRLWPVAMWYVETEIAASAINNTALLYPLWRGKIVPYEAREQQLYDAAYRLYGFAPISPDQSKVVFDEKRDLVVNEKHGSVSEPWFPRQPTPDSPVGQLLHSVRNVRASLEFRLDGAYTVLTIERNSAQAR